MPILLSRSELSRRLGVNPRTLDRLVKEGKIPEPIRLSKKTLRWDEEQVGRRLQGQAPGETSGQES